MENLTLVIGNKLKNIRNSRNLSLDDVAELTGVS
ncbi:helix-turn-helix domain-containing protein, partial [Clostridium butyricum]